jgi:hypothetical protein
MRYGDLVVTTAIYRSQCACEMAVEMARGEECPACPRCDAPADWAYERTTYRPPPDAGQVPDGVPGRQVRASAP